MKAVALIRHRVVLAIDAFAEISVWRLPEPVPPSEPPFKYRLAYVVGGECVLRYDNERGKGDHRHAGQAEPSYAFVTPEHLVSDFNADIERWNHEHGRA
ncbi:MAG: toxin-antitoxin system TumE family protein [Pseudomonadota bacterium]